ncbi:hypothetical protein [Sandaracinus amylolyticus]|uniref:Uncharacterized protein n=1 Tax=Sandaracinus amylolyticus TaxID=927083 RepID=A0A0F6YHH8_9BACT|nr:hypothetical protein [Sandaracinus amylolyticus]AKF05678.1 hypothetical protein DB32_002827 [Sandaracinus amylolyticus]
MSEREIDRSLIDAAREGLGPSAEERARLRRAVAATIAGGAVAGTAVSGAAASATAAKAVAAWSAWKIVAAAALATTVVGGAAIAVIASRDAPSPRREVAPDAPVDPLPEVHLAPIDAPEQPATEEPAPEPPAPERAAPVRAASPDRVQPRATGPARDALLAETALLREAHRALRAHDATRALALLDDHAARFPQGALREERAATRVLALCEAGLTAAARTEADRFLAAHPRSMHAARVRASCGAAPIQ